MTKFMAVPILKILHELPYWYIILRVFNFMILAREYFAGVFFFAISTRKYEKRAINSQAHFIFKKSESFQISSLTGKVMCESFTKYRFFTY